MKYSEQDPHLAEMWLPYEEAGELLRQGRTAEAIPKAEQALTAGERLLGPTSNHLFLPLFLLANCYREVGRHADALALYQRVAAITEVQFGARHPNHGRILASIAAMYRRLGRPADALPLDEQNLAIQVTTHGRNHPGTVRVVTDLLDDYHDLGDRAEAARYLELAERLAKGVPGVDDHTLARIEWHRSAANR